MFEIEDEKTTWHEKKNEKVKYLVNVDIIRFSG